MKALLLLLLTVTMASAQMKIEDTPKWDLVGKVPAMGSFHSTIEKSNGQYMITYRDVEFPHITELKSIVFTATESDMDNLYNTVMQGFEDMQEKRVTLADDIIDFQYFKSMGVVAVKFFHVNAKTGIQGRSDNMTKKQVAKLFGKNLKK